MAIKVGEMQAQVCARLRVPGERADRECRRHPTDRVFLDGGFARSVAAGSADDGRPSVRGLGPLW